MLLLIITELFAIKTVLLFSLAFLLLGSTEFTTEMNVLKKQSHLIPMSCKNDHLELNKSVFKYNIEKNMYRRKRSFLKDFNQYFKSNSFSTCTPYFIQHSKSMNRKPSEKSVFSKSQMSDNSIELNTDTTVNTVKTSKTKKDKLKNLFFLKYTLNISSPENASVSLGKVLGENNAKITTNRSENKLGDHFEQESVSSSHTPYANAEHTHSNRTRPRHKFRGDKMKNMIRNVWGNITIQNQSTVLDYLTNNYVQENLSSTQLTQNEISVELSSKVPFIQTHQPKCSKHFITEIFVPYLNKSTTAKLLSRTPASNLSVSKMPEIFSSVKYTTESKMYPSSHIFFNKIPKFLKNISLHHDHKINNTEYYLTTKKNLSLNSNELEENLTSTQITGTFTASANNTLFVDEESFINKNESVTKIIPYRHFNIQKHAHKNSVNKKYHKKNIKKQKLQSNILCFLKTKSNWEIDKTEAMTPQAISTIAINTNINDIIDSSSNTTTPTVDYNVDSDFIVAGGIHKAFSADSSNDNTLEETTKINNNVSLIDLDISEILYPSKHEEINREFKKQLSVHDSSSKPPKLASNTQGNNSHSRTQFMTSDQINLHFTSNHYENTSFMSKRFHLRNILKFTNEHKYNSVVSLQPNPLDEGESDIPSTQPPIAKTSIRNSFELQIPPTPHLNVEFSSRQSDQHSDISVEPTRNTTNNKGVKFLKNMLNLKKKLSSANYNKFAFTYSPVNEANLSNSKTLHHNMEETALKIHSSTLDCFKSTEQPTQSNGYNRFFLNSLFNFKKLNMSTESNEEIKITANDTIMSSSPTTITQDWSNIPVNDVRIQNNLFENNTCTNIFKRKHKLKKILRFHKSSTLEKSGLVLESDYSTVTGIVNGSESTTSTNLQPRNEIFSSVTPQNQFNTDNPDDRAFQNSDRLLSTVKTRKSLVKNFRMNFNRIRDHNTVSAKVDQDTTEGFSNSTQLDLHVTLPSTDLTLELSQNEHTQIGITRNKFVQSWLFKNKQKIRNSSSDGTLDYGKENLFKWYPQETEKPQSQFTDMDYSSGGFCSTITCPLHTLKQNGTTKALHCRNRIKEIFKFKSLTTINSTEVLNNTNIQYSEPTSENTEMVFNINQTLPMSSSAKNTKIPYFYNIRKRTKPLAKKAKGKGSNKPLVKYGPAKDTSNSSKKFQNLSEENGDTQFTVLVQNNISSIIFNTTNQTSSTVSLHPNYMEYTNSSTEDTKTEVAQPIESALKNITLLHNNTFHIMAYVMKPLENLISIFKATPHNLTQIDVNASEIQNSSLPDYLHTSNSSIIILAVNNTTNSSKEIHEAKYGVLDVLKGWFQCVVESFREPTVQDIHFYLYTRNNSDTPEELLLNEEPEPDNNTDIDIPEPVYEQESLSEMARRRRQYEEDYSFEYLSPAKSGIQSKWFNVLSETKVLVHGYIQDYQTDIMTDMKDAYLKKGDYNVIIVDWSVIGDNSCYPMVATKGQRAMGLLLARLLDQLATGGVSLSRVHLVGFSLGAHVAGHAGSKLNNGLVYRITAGLDPALPYVPMETEVSLDAGDALFVDIIHSGAGFLGQPGPMGHVDFYPNGGSNQPGCDISSFGACSHRRAALYFIESINLKGGFPAVRCESWQAFQAGLCNNTTTLPMGENCPSNATGKYYLLTGQSQPFTLLREEDVKVKKSFLLDLLYDSV